METVESLERNDLIYKNPPIHGWEGWLQGNGSAGATIWNPSDSIQMQFGHTDLIDRGGAVAEESYSGPCLRHAGQAALEICDLPLFDPMYLKEYYARLCLADGMLETTGQSQFGKFSFRTFYAESPAVFFLQYKDETSEAVRRRICLRHFGSRTLGHFFGWILDRPEIGLDGTTARVENNTLLIEHDYKGFRVTLAARVNSGNKHTWSRTKHSVSLEFTPCCTFELEFRVAIGLGKANISPTAEAVAALDNMANIPIEGCLAEERTRRRNAWPSSAIRLPEDPYWENLWYLARYHLRASSRGQYPCFFINGPWGFHRDVRAWPTCWYHWNMHGSYLPIPETGDGDLFDSYCQWRLNQLPVSRKTAREMFGAEGMVMEDQQKPDGGNYGKGRESPKLYFVVVNLQLSLHLYRYWRFTGNREFLRNVLYPIFKETVEFWHCYLEEGEDSKLHVPQSHPYEFAGKYTFRDCLTDLAHLCAALPAFSEVAEAVGENTELAKWAEQAVAKLAEFHPIELPAEHVTKVSKDGNRYYDNPFFYGQPYQQGDSVYAIGFSEKEQQWVSHVETHFDPESGYGALCSSQTAHIFPCGLTTSDASPNWADVTECSAEERKVWEMARNALRTIRRYPPDEVQPDKASLAEPAIAWTGHSLELPAFARLGLTRELRKAIDFYIDRYQMFPQGMWNYHPRKRWLLGYSFPRPVIDKEQLRLDFNPFGIHFSMEPQGIFTESVTLMLLDCIGGVIRLFQAYERDAWFRLPAWDGFWVTAQQQNGKLAYVRIESLRGSTCTIRLPWQKVTVACGAGKSHATTEKGILKIETEKGQGYLLTDEKGSSKVKELPEQQLGPHACGHSTVGIFKRM